MPSPAAATHSDVVILGGGNAGISLAARLRRYGVKDVAVVEPREHHLYQPLLSHIAGGTAPGARDRIQALAPHASRAADLGSHRGDGRGGGGGDHFGA